MTVSPLLQSFEHLRADVVGDSQLHEHRLGNRIPLPVAQAIHDRGIGRLIARQLGHRIRRIRIARHLHAQRAVRDPQRLLRPGDHDRHVGCQAGAQEQIRVVDFDDAIEIGDGALLGWRRRVLLLRRRVGIADLCEAPAERAIGNRIDRERHGLPRMHGPHVDLADRRDDAHLREVLRDHEQRRSAEARLHGLADLHLFEDHDAIDGRRDRAAVEIHLRVLESGLPREQRGACLFELRFHLIVVGLGDEVLLAQVFQAFRVQAHESGIRFGGRAYRPAPA